MADPKKTKKTRKNKRQQQTPPQKPSPSEQETNANQKREEEEEMNLPYIPPVEEEDLSALEEKDIEELEKILDYRFHNKALLQEAVTHCTFYLGPEGKRSYERLEFIGDAVLNALIADYLFSTYTELQPGMLTKLRSANVDMEKLARVTVSNQLHIYLRHRIPMLDIQILQFIGESKDYAEHSYGLIDTPKVASDILESIVGAVFVDSNKSYDMAWKVFRRLAGDSFITPDTLGAHPITGLKNLCESLRLNLEYKDKNWTQDHTVDVLINGTVMGTAVYNFKKQICRNRAAKIALDSLMELQLKKDLSLLTGANEDIS